MGTAGGIFSLYRFGFAVKVRSGMQTEADVRRECRKAIDADPRFNRMPLTWRMTMAAKAARRWTQHQDQLRRSKDVQLGPTNHDETAKRNAAEAEASEGVESQKAVQELQMEKAEQAPADPTTPPPATNGKAAGKLPEDFPHRAALEAEGITTFAKLRKAGDMTEIPGIGPKSAADIADALAAAEGGDENTDPGQTTGTGK